MDAVRRAAWREPMLWLVAGLPLAVVAAAFATIYVARHTGIDESAARTRRNAHVQIEDHAADREAASTSMPRVAPSTCSSTRRCPHRRR